MEELSFNRMEGIPYNLVTLSFYFFGIVGGVIKKLLSINAEIEIYILA